MIQVIYCMPGLSFGWLLVHPLHAEGKAVSYMTHHLPGWCWVQAAHDTYREALDHQQN